MLNPKIILPLLQFMFSVAALSALIAQGNAWIFIVFYWAVNAIRNFLDYMHSWEE